jgi:hypothetical protein
MKEDYTHISVILDRTGSMEVIRDDTIGGFNAFLKDQQQEEGDATLTLVQFDTQDPYEVIHQFAPIHSIPPLTEETFIPRAQTPLLDAIGRGIKDLEKRLARLDPDERPAKVVFVIITDGQENSSWKYRKRQIARMLHRKQEQDDWQLVFLSADMASIFDAYSYGFKPYATMKYERDARGTASAWASLSGEISRYRRERDDMIFFTEDDGNRQRKKGKRKRWD